MVEENYDNIEGELDLDAHGNLKFRPKDGDKKGEGITDSGTYVLRDGKLVKGSGESREQAEFTNWYCSNADPEDIRRHREMMDRMTYRGPKWDGIGVPKTSMEEMNPVYPNRPAEPHPSEKPETEGKKEFEFVVR